MVNKFRNYRTITINFRKVLGKHIDIYLCDNYNTYRQLSMGGEYMDLDEKKTAIIFKAFCDENRIKILKLLVTGEKCACKLLEEINVTQPTLSHHMKILCDSGVVTGHKDGKWTYYSISIDGAGYALKCLQELTNTEDRKQIWSCCEK